MASLLGSASFTTSSNTLSPQFFEKPAVCPGKVSVFSRLTPVDVRRDTCSSSRVNLQSTFAKSGLQTLRHVASRAQARAVERSLGVVEVCRCKVETVTEANFTKEVLESNIPVLVDFWATWCGPCRLVLPAVEALAKEYDGRLKVVKCETDPNPQLVAQYKVYGLPAIVLFENGAVAAQQEGAITKAKLVALLKEKLPSLVAETAAS
eukprot:TRINITY_DN39106_c0_g1_i1.p1 TRINITY_DN39106_c0_g1~~TRINITY_DN39106_c0_g1_i1.p1  ORF type:complete len:207 (-),score=23.92 TRINITY_DN39106_c0_g1_i1:1065-1685(-)